VVVVVVTEVTHRSVAPWAVTVPVEMPAGTTYVPAEGIAVVEVTKQGTTSVTWGGSNKSMKRPTSMPNGRQISRPLSNGAAATWEPNRWAVPSIERRVRRDVMMNG